MGAARHPSQAGTGCHCPFCLSFLQIEIEKCLNERNAPCLLQVGLLNVDGYYNSLLTFIDKAVEEGFINTSARRIIVLAPTAEELMEKLEVHTYFLTLNLNLNSRV